MIKNEKHAVQVQGRRLEQGRFGLAKAVKTFGAKIQDNDKRREFFDSLPQKRTEVV